MLFRSDQDAPPESEQSPHAAGGARDSGLPRRLRRARRRQRAKRQIPRGEHGHESRPNVPRTRTRPPPQSGVARKGDAAGSSRRSRSQALAALPTACLEHLASARRRHAYAKAVRLTPVLLLGLVRPLDGRLSETLIASGALLAPLSPTGLLREYTKAGDDRPFIGRICRREITGPWCARSGCERGRALLDSAGCSGSGKPSTRLIKPPGHQRPCIYPLMCTSCG